VFLFLCLSFFIVLPFTYIYFTMSQRYHFSWEAKQLLILLRRCQSLFEERQQLLNHSDMVEMVKLYDTLLKDNYEMIQFYWMETSDAEKQDLQRLQKQQTELLLHHYFLEKMLFETRSNLNQALLNIIVQMWQLVQINVTVPLELIRKYQEIMFILYGRESQPVENIRYIFHKKESQNPKK